ncbi:GNAT family N-acetyltransferase [Blastococcus tunisiensis]|uniref:Acetyltransferase (GNAT) family protein n=1 Tax=Blastococcus tunisiensis TaxID=1798228 RepID=A0A1I2BWM5_9ACTN|nr:GNAT family N-acetyltransferase [Blastococcus sp. DSM 46838]SFE60382.1 Acetyltransferase (GNAT) family protein [Blastococcus sp. DSM 46838]
MSRDLQLVGFEELSAGVLRDRLLADRASFWSGSRLTGAEIRALHDPVFFHQFGGFGGLARTPYGGDAGYLLGVVSADRLGVVHALAVRPEFRGRGVAVRLLERFAGVAASVAARAVQAVAPPGDDVVAGLARRFGASASPAPGHAGPGADRVLYTWLPAAG